MPFHKNGRQWRQSARQGEHPSQLSGVITIQYRVRAWPPLRARWPSPSFTVCKAVEGRWEKFNARNKGICSGLLGLPLFHRTHCSSIAWGKLISNIANGSWLKDNRCLCCRKIRSETQNSRTAEQQRPVKRESILGLFYLFPAVRRHSTVSANAVEFHAEHCVLCAE